MFPNDDSKQNNKEPSLLPEDNSDDIFRDDFHGNIQDDDFFDFSKALDNQEQHEFSSSLTDEAKSMNNGGEAAAAFGVSPEAVESGTTLPERARTVRFFNEDDPNSELVSSQNLELERSLTIFEESNFYDASPTTVATEKGWLDDMDDEDFDDYQAVEEPEEQDSNGKAMMMAIGLGVAGFLLRVAFRKVVNWFTSQNQPDAAGATTDAANEGADTTAQVKGAAGMTGHNATGASSKATGDAAMQASLHTSTNASQSGAAGAASKASTSAAMQTSFHASGGVSQSSSNLVGGFMVNNPSSTMSAAQYVTLVEFFCMLTESRTLRY